MSTIQKLQSYFLNNYTLVVLVTIIVRCLFVALYPLNSYEFFHADSHEYVALADRALSGNFNFDVVRFIRSPLYPIFIALHKFLFHGYWEHALVVSQILLSSATAIFLCKISKQLFENKTVELITGLLYAVYLPVFYYVSSFTAETLYMFLNVVSMYYLVRLLNDNNIKNILGYGISFTLAYLTRAEIMLFGPSVILLCLYFFKKKAFKICLQLVCIWVVLVSPWSLVNLKIHKTFLTSSNGGMLVFYLSNSALGYADAVETPPIGSAAYDSLTSDYNFYNPGYDSIMRLPQSAKQAALFQESIQWIRNNPKRFIEIKFWNAVNFFSPGLTIGHHESKIWMAMFFLTLPFHLLFYIGLYKAIRNTGLSKHLWFIVYFICMFIFLVIFLYTERFRAYSIEEYYLIYGGYAIVNFKRSSFPYDGR